MIALRPEIPDYAPGADEPARRLECYVTPPAVIRALLAVELFTPVVWDCCCGSGAIARELVAAGYRVVATDIHDWGHGERRDLDFLATTEALAPSIVMNPPFSRAAEFAEHAWRLGVRKLAMVQRFAFWESLERVHGLWSRRPPQRLYGFDRRPAFWRIDVAPGDRGGSTPTAHAWFVWERGQPAGTAAGHLHLGDRGWA